MSLSGKVVLFLCLVSLCECVSPDLTASRDENEPAKPLDHYNVSGRIGTLTTWSVNVVQCFLIQLPSVHITACKSHHCTDTA